MRITFACLLLLVGGCGDTQSQMNTPHITISDPKDGTVFPLIMSTTVDIPVTFTVSDFTLVAPTGQANVAGHGHAHLFLDQETTYRAIGVSPLTAKLVPAGNHTLKITLHNNDHTPIDTVAPATVSVVVQ